MRFSTDRIKGERLLMLWNARDELLMLARAGTVSGRFEIGIHFRTRGIGLRLWRAK